MVVIANCHRDSSTSSISKPLLKIKPVIISPPFVTRIATKALDSVNYIIG
ncbi:hypothetical protein HMPREF1148_0920 [Selenomonas sp. FOBRC6]|nr:hypothetical protein HMPREF1148_0920 [Selenomonas sp. FOBRC6]